MLVWLASYPRSGNTLVRAILKQNLGLDTWSLYDDRRDIGANVDLSSRVGHVQHGKTREEFIEWARASDQLIVCKTHELPIDDAPAIYIVRDGRAAIISYFYYLANVIQSPRRLEEVLFGAVWPGPWSSHVKAWALAERPNTLSVRYEDLIGDDLSSIETLARFLKRPIRDRRPLSFDNLRSSFPAFFHRGSNGQNVTDMESTFPAFYNLLHGTTAETLDYPLCELGRSDQSLKQEYDKMRRDEAVLQS